MWRVEPLLRHDSELDGYTRAVSGQRLGKYFPAFKHERDDGTKIEELCFLCGLCLDVISKGQG
jgi:hypothetical protein